MYFLEDFLDNIEHLPQEIRTCLTGIKDIDMQVGRSMNDLENDVEALFRKANSISPNELETRFSKIMEDGDKSVEKSEEKVQMADHMHDILLKYMSQLDVNLYQLKMELEVDNSGVTERIEKRCLDSEQLNIANHNENNLSLNRSLIGDKQDASNTVGNKAVARHSRRGRRPAKSQKTSSSLASTLEHTGASGSPAIAAAASQAIGTTKKRRRRHAKSQKTSSSLASTLGHMGAGDSSAIVAAASQAIVTTKQRGRPPANSQKPQSSLASTLGRIGTDDSPAIAAAASQAIVAPKQRGRPPAKSQKTSSSLASTSGHMGADGNSAIAAAASQPIVATKQRGRPPAKSQKTSSSLASTLGHMGTDGSSAIAAAASQAIVTSKKLSQEYRAANLNGSFKEKNVETPSTGQMSSASTCVFPLELPIVNELAGIDHSVNLNMDGTRKYDRSGGAQSSQLLIEEDVEEPTDPNEPRYCVCNQVAFGTMVACDSKNCVYEWYHCECVGIMDPPKGKWYCPQCLTKKKTRRSHKPHKLH